MSPYQPTFASEQTRYLEKFLKTRKSDDTKKYAKIILDYLTEKMSVETQGWVRSRVIANDLVSPDKVPNTSTFYKLLHDLEEFHLIERKTEVKEKPGPGALPVYYRASLGFPSMLFMTREELLKEYDKLQFNFKKVSARLNGAEELLNECHKDDPNFDVKITIRNYVNKKYRVHDPSLSLEDPEKFCGYLEFLERRRNSIYGKK